MYIHGCSLSRRRQVPHHPYLKPKVRIQLPLEDPQTYLVATCMQPLDIPASPGRRVSARVPPAASSTRDALSASDLTFPVGLLPAGREQVSPWLCLARICWRYEYTRVDMQDAAVDTVSHSIVEGSWGLCAQPLDSTAVGFWMGLQAVFWCLQRRQGDDMVYLEHLMPLL